MNVLSAGSNHPSGDAAGPDGSHDAHFGWTCLIKYSFFCAIKPPRHFPTFIFIFAHFIYLKGMHRYRRKMHIPFAFQNNKITHLYRRHEHIMSKNNTT